VARLRGASTFVATNASFEYNTANQTGGVAYLSSSSSFSARNSSFIANQASGRNFSGDVTYLVGSSNFELYNTTTLRDQANVVRCDGTGTIYAALLLDMNLTEGLFTLGESCVLFLYQTNNDGSQEYADALIERNVASSGTVNFVQWSDPELKQSNSQITYRQRKH